MGDVILSLLVGASLGSVLGVAASLIWAFSGILEFKRISDVTMVMAGCVACVAIVLLLVEIAHVY